MPFTHHAACALCTLQYCCYLTKTRTDDGFRGEGLEYITRKYYTMIKTERGGIVVSENTYFNSAAAPFTKHQSQHIFSSIKCFSLFAFCYIMMKVVSSAHWLRRKKYLHLRQIYKIFQWMCLN